MNARYLSATTALITATVLLLVAGGCAKDSSSDSAGSGEEKIAGAEQSSKGATPSASAAAPGGVERPRITLPGTFRMDFEGWTNSDPKLQAILDDGREALRADHAAITGGNPDAAYVTFYNSPQSAANSRKWIKGFVDDDLTLIGKARVFDPQVHINEEGSGVLFYCLDESNGSTKNRKTGEVKGTPKGESPRAQYRTLLNRTKDGVWKTASATTTRGAC